MINFDDVTKENIRNYNPNSLLNSRQILIYTEY